LSEYLRGLKNPFRGSHHIRGDVFFELFEKFVERVQDVGGTQWATRRDSKKPWERDDLLAVDYAFSLCCCEGRELTHPIRDVWSILNDVMEKQPPELRNAWHLYQAFIVGLYADGRGENFTVAEDFTGLEQSPAVARSAWTAVWTKYRDCCMSDGQASNDTETYILVSARSCLAVPLTLLFFLSIRAWHATFPLPYSISHTLLSLH
jgi:hypothetical protein